MPTRTFRFDKETPRTRRYKEEVRDGETPVAGYFYIQKDALAKEGKEQAESIVLTIHIP